MNAGFRALHPLPVFLYYVSVMLLSILLLHPVYLAVSVTLLGAVRLVCVPKLSALRTMLLLVVIGLAASLLNPLFSHRGEHILFYVGDQPFTGEAFLYGVTLALSMLSVVFAFLSYRHVVTSDKFLFLFSPWWPKGALITVIALRFVPLLLSRFQEVAAAQQMKGASVLHGPLAKRAGDAMRMLQILLTWSLEEALQTADAMKSRGYGLGPRSHYAAYRMRRRDLLATAFVAALCLLCIAGRLSGLGVFTIYPAMESWRIAGLEWAQLGLFSMLVGWPLLYEGKEWLAWR